MFNLEPAAVLAKIMILLVALPFHELAHAWSATYFGDDTPRMNGRLSLNPIRHLDVIGSLLILVGGFGWAKPVPINPYALQRRSPAAVMLVSLAGPISNFFLAALAAIPWRLGLVHYTTQAFSVGNLLVNFIIINLGLMLFNLIPLAPLDGEKIADYFLPASWSRFMDNIRPYSPMILMALIFLGPALGFDVLGWIMGPPMQSLLRLLLGV
ncbi:MAG TPA: site-2 protease family protein [Anaerolineaceae bacterium]|nr:site-2 protease family protein [Anaerolineaceae bacterium]